MGIGFTLLLILHVLVCVLLILLVLVQNDKGGGLAGAFGGMGGGAAFSGSSAVTILTRATQWMGIVAFVVLISLNFMSLKAHRAAQNDSELKGARKGLSAVLPSNSPAGSAIPGLGGGNAPSPAIPGLGVGESKGSGK